MTVVAPSSRRLARLLWALSIQAQSSLAVNGFDGQTNAALSGVGSALAYEVGDVWNDNGRVALNARWAAQLEAPKRCAGDKRKKKNAAPWVLVICVVLINCRHCVHRSESRRRPGPY